MQKRFFYRFQRGMALCTALLFLATSCLAPGQVVPPLSPEEGGDQQVSLKFSNAPLDQVLDFYSDLTGKTIIKSPGVNANITLRARNRLSAREALIAIESALQMANVGLVPMGEKFLKVVQVPSVRNAGMPLQTSLPDEELEETDKLISQVVDLQYIEISEAKPILEQVKNNYGKILTLDRTNSLLITDTSQNLKRMLEILDYIDRPAPVREDIFVREIQYAEAGEIASKLNELIQESQAQQGQGDDGQTRIPPPSQGQAPAGVIRAPSVRQAAQRAAQQQQQGPGSAAELAAAELAERGIIQGTVKIVADDRTNILFILSRPENFAFFDKIINVLDRPMDPEFIVRVVSMEFADASEIAGILNEFIGAASAEDGAPAGGGARETDGEGAGEDGTSRSQALREFVRNRARRQVEQVAGEEASKVGRLSPDTKILADERTNSLMLMGRRSDIAALVELIDQLDIMLGQVLIEVVILEVRLSNDLSYGVDWLQRSFTVYNEENVGPRGGANVRTPVFSFGGGQRVQTDSSFIDATGVGRDTAIGGTLTYYATLFDLNIDAIIQLAASSSDARILSTPVVLTTDNTEAQISVGEERPVVTTTSTTSAGTIRSSFEYRNIGINLTVTPRINPERFVVMEVTQTADGIAGTVDIDGNEVPIITKREFSASVAVDNRQTIVMGGLVSKDKSLSRSKVPLLGDIPVLGTLFRSDSRNDVRTELLVMLTPYVMMTPQEAQQETERLYSNITTDRPILERGWSDSPLAVTPETERKKRRKRKTEQEPADAVERTYEPPPRETTSYTPRVIVVPGSDDRTNGAPAGSETETGETGNQSTIDLKGPAPQPLETPSMVISGDGSEGAVPAPDEPSQPAEENVPADPETESPQAEPETPSPSPGDRAAGDAPPPQEETPSASPRIPAPTPPAPDDNRFAPVAR